MQPSFIREHLNSLKKMQLKRNADLIEYGMMTGKHGHNKQGGTVTHTCGWSSAALLVFCLGVQILCSAPRFHTLHFVNKCGLLLDSLLLLQSFLIS